MDRSLSLFEHLLQRFGALLGALLVVAAVGVYFENETSAIDKKSVALLQNARAAVAMAEREARSYLASGKAPDLESYNREILKIGQAYQQLSETLREAEDVRTAWRDVQTASKNHFLTLNENILKKQSRAGKNLSFHTDETEVANILNQLGQISDEIQRHSSKHWGAGAADLPIALWQLLGLLLLASYALWRYHVAGVHAKARFAKDVSDLKIQSILLDGILNSISEAMIVIDENGRFTRYNSAAERIIGKKLKSISSEADAEAFGFFQLESGAPVALADLPFERALRGEQLEDVEYLVRNEAQPHGMYISISSRYLTGVTGQIQGALVVFRDVSRRKATEKEWLRARESALETARKKSEFLAAMSHEIRTPMNGVMGMATLLADTTLSHEQSDYVGTIQRSAEALLRLINDILDHSKIEAGVVEFNAKAFDLEVLCADVLELFHPAVREKNVDLTAEFAGESAWTLLGDAGRLRQILVNLLGNAVKFTDVGHIRLFVEALPTTGAGARASTESLRRFKVSISDTGPGFSETESEFLFQKYFQTKAGMRYGGTGLGLSICHQLIELMGGTIGLESQPGVGSTFWFTLELPIAERDQIVAPTEHSFAPIFSGRVLLAEDQIINQRVAATYLQKLGLEVEIAGNGQIAVQKAMAAPYDLILMDCQMPILTGYEATKKIRELQAAAGAARTTIVALTAEGTSGERKTCIAAGMDDFLTKPLELEKLTETLRRWLKNAPQVLDLKALEKLKSYVVNNKSLTDALIEDFLQTGPQLFDDMETGLREGSLERVGAAAHALKSCSATLGAKGLAELCQKIEDAEELSVAQMLFGGVRAQLDASAAELKKHRSTGRTPMDSAA